MPESNKTLIEELIRNGLMIFFASSVTFLLNPTKDMKSRVRNWLAGICGGLMFLIFFTVYKPPLAYVYQGVILIITSSFVSVIWPILAKRVAKKSETIGDDVV